MFCRFVKINSVQYCNKTRISKPQNSYCSQILFARDDKKVKVRRNPFVISANKLRDFASDKFFKRVNVLDAKSIIYHRFNHEFDVICDEHQTTRAERDSLITKFDFSTLNKETELVLDENKNLKHVFIRNTQDDTKSLKLDFDKERLSGATYIINGKKIKLDINSSDFNKLFSYSSDFDLNTGILIGDINARKFFDGHILKHFDSINNVVYGKMSKGLRNAVEEYEEKFQGKKIYVDHNVEPDVVKTCIDVLEEIPFNDIPNNIILTNFLEDDTAGLYCLGDEIVVRPSKNKDYLARRIYHEIQHRKDYLLGKPLGQINTGLALEFNHKILHDCDGQILEGKIKKQGNSIVFIDEELKELISEKVSRYATENASEYIAEVGAMMRSGTIGVCKSPKSNNILYSIKEDYVNEDLEKAKINEKEFKTLLQVYGLLGGTPEFNNAIYCKDAVGLTQEEIYSKE